jgi:hypothetical protein
LPGSGPALVARTSAYKCCPAARGRCRVRPWPSLRLQPDSGNPPVPAERVAGVRPWPPLRGSRRHEWQSLEKVVVAEAGPRPSSRVPRRRPAENAGLLARCWGSVLGPCCAYRILDHCWAAYRGSGPALVEQPMSTKPSRPWSVLLRKYSWPSLRELHGRPGDSESQVASPGLSWPLVERSKRLGLLLLRTERLPVEPGPRCAQQRGWDAAVLMNVLGLGPSPRCACSSQSTPSRSSQVLPGVHLRPSLHTVIGADWLSREKERC